MKFKVSPELFERIPNVCFGVVVGYGIDNTQSSIEISKMLKEEMKSIRERVAGQNLKEFKHIVPYREAFKELGINPNKFTSSIEAMAKRVLNGNDLPSVNPVVDLVNALSLKYIFPMGAHDMDALEEEIAVRFAKSGDTFIPLGSEDIEEVDAGELVYADNKQIRTRRWVWRQSERGKITADSKNIFFPIDGFLSDNKENVMKAVDELAILLEKLFGVKTQCFFVDKDHNEIEF
ncbi:MAG: B3/4 domain-containing protein [Bacillota bacterium]